ncbi:MAG: helix-turn-helix domain-containing protein [Thermoanaerobaculia bacterium]
MAALVTAQTSAPRIRLGGYREYTPPPDLSGFLEAVWSYSRPAGTPPIPGAGHRVIPGAALSIAFSSLRDRDGRLLDARLVLIGRIRQARFFAPEPGREAVAVRLHPEWPRDLLGVDPHDHSDVTASVAMACRARLSDSFDRLTRTASNGEAIAVLLDIVRRVIDSARISREGRLAHEARQWVSSRVGSPVSLGEISRELGISERHLRRVVKTATGTSPKQLHRIRRVEGAMLEADSMLRPDWARLAAGNGFYDQPHMIQEFRSVTGCSPAQLHAERRLQS